MLSHKLITPRVKRACLAVSIMVVATLSYLPATSPPVYSAFLAAPAVQIQSQDDRAAVISWSAVTGSVGGYRVVWGPASNPTQNSAITPYTELELQPLTNGAQYQATVQAVDYQGTAGAMSAPVSFTGDSSRVDALRSQMTGFFDDFNGPQGALDPLKWGQAFSFCTNPGTAGSFTNAQFHAHQLTGASGCDRAQVVMRPRTQFDFTNRTGTIAFDFDGVFRRNQWYLDILPDTVDIDGHTGNGLGYQTNFIRIDNVAAFGGDGIVVNWIDASAGEHMIAGNTAQSMGINFIPNVRRHWIVKLSKTHITITINGGTVIDTSLTDTTMGLPSTGLPFTKATLLNALFTYNQHKENLPATLAHEDTFGFDGPPSTSVTHDYLDPNYYSGEDRMMVSGWLHQYPLTATVQIPDSVAGATDARLRFTLGGGTDGWDHNGDSPESIQVNGVDVPFTIPTCPNRSYTGACVSTITPFAYSIPITPSILHTGDNTVTYRLNSSAVMGTHLELDFPQGSAPTYTPPSYDAMAPMMAVGDVGPSLTASVNGQSFQQTCCSLAENAHNLFPVSGTVNLTWSATSEAAMQAAGGTTGVRDVQVLLDGNVIYDGSTNADAPAPSTSGAFSFPTVGLLNGPHALLVRAYNPNGTLSIPDYFQGGVGVSADWPVTISVQNASPPTQETPLATVPPPVSRSTATPQTAASPTSAVNATATPTTFVTHSSPTATAAVISSPTPDVTPTKTPVVPGCQPTMSVGFNQGRLQKEGLHSSSLKNSAKRASLRRNPPARVRVLCESPIKIVSVSISRKRSHTKPYAELAIMLKATKISSSVRVTAVMYRHSLGRNVGAPMNSTWLLRRLTAASSTIVTHAWQVSSDSGPWTYVGIVRVTVEGSSPDTTTTPFLYTVR